MKIPSRKREELLDRFIIVASNVVKQLDIPSSVSHSMSSTNVQSFPLFGAYNTGIPVQQQPIPVQQQPVPVQQQPIPVQQQQTIQTAYHTHSRPLQTAVQSQYRQPASQTVTFDVGQQGYLNLLGIDAPPTPRAAAGIMPTPDDDDLDTFARNLTTINTSAIVTDSSTVTSTTVSNTCAASTTSVVTDSMFSSSF